MGDDVKAPCLICQKNVQIIEVMTATIERLLKEKAIRNEALEEAQTKGKPMSILTEKEREDVYRYWLKSTTLTDEDGLIQITERAVLERLAGMALPKSPLATKQCNITYECTCADDATTCPKPTVDLYTADQLHQAYAQGAASQLHQEPALIIRERDSDIIPAGTKLYIRKEAK